MGSADRLTAVYGPVATAVDAGGFVHAPRTVELNRQPASVQFDPTALSSRNGALSVTDQEFNSPYGIAAAHGERLRRRHRE
jgi:hypothetical protein